MKDKITNLTGRRNELCQHLRDLADISYQRSAWVDEVNEFRNNGRYPAVVDNFTEKIHFFFDDTMLFDNPALELGNLVSSVEEMNAVVAVVTAIDAVLIAGGKRLTDEQYLQLPEWERVVRSASDALNILTCNQNL